MSFVVWQKSHALTLKTIRAADLANELIHDNDEIRAGNHDPRSSKQRVPKQ